MGAMERKGGSMECRVFGKWGVGSMGNEIVVRERSDVGGYSEADGYCIRRGTGIGLRRTNAFISYQATTLPSVPFQILTLTLTQAIPS
jgi:hypothetical protein